MSTPGFQILGQQSADRSEKETDLLLQLAGIVDQGRLEVQLQAHGSAADAEVVVDDPLAGADFELHGHDFSF
jgi:hypothetical protein